VVLATVLTRNNRQGRSSKKPTFVAGAEVTNVAATMTPSSSPTSSLELTLEYQLLKPYVKPPSKLLNATTPQGKAFRQILSENLANFGNDVGFRVKQRFAMMAVYFSMGGENWTWRTGRVQLARGRHLPIP